MPQNLINDFENLENIFGLMEGYRERFIGIYSVLNRMSVYNELSSSFNTNIDKMKEISEELNSAANALNDIAHIYIMTEKKLTIEAETLRNILNGIVKAIDDILTPKTDVEKLVESLEKQYGFSEEDAKLIAEAWDKFEESKEAQGLTYEEKIHKFFGCLAAFHEGYSGSDTKFKVVCGTPTQEEAKKFFKSIGYTDDEIKRMCDAIENQHAGKVGNGNRDFVHECVIITEMAYSGAVKMGLDVIDDPDALISYKGDIYSRSMGKDDINSDIDAMNLYNRIKNSSNPMEAMNEYYEGCNNGTINPSEEFLKNYGDGDAEKGLEKVEKIIDQKSIATDTLGHSYGYGKYGSGKNKNSNDFKKKFIEHLKEESGL